MKKTSTFFSIIRRMMARLSLPDAVFLLARHFFIQVRISDRIFCQILGFILLTSIANAQACTPYPKNAILQPGYSIVTCLPGADQVVLAVKDIRQLGTLWDTPTNRNPEQKFYYAVWANNIAFGITFGPASSNNNVIRSLSIAADGSLVTASDALAMTIPFFPQSSGATTYSEPVSDIEFNAAGTKVLLGESGITTPMWGHP